MLGNPRIALKRHISGRDAADDPIVKVGPTAQDLAGLGRDFYLDFPGDPRKPDCVYETDFKEFAAAIDAKPTTYAHIVIDRKRHELILQYYFWWYFNDWNNTHESDWEMIQLIFDATTVNQALHQTPSRVGYAAHNGGETAKWTDDKFHHEGDHPIVYPAAGSHASYFGQGIYLGWGEQGAGFGCDNTSPPSVRTPLTAVLLPSLPLFTGPFAWLEFRGNWGERQPWAFNGPTGPAFSLLWTDPIKGMKNWRPSSLKIASGSNGLGPNATEFFCDVTKSGSQLLIRFGTEPRLLAGGIAAVFLIFTAMVVIWGKLLGAALAIYARHLRVFLAIGVWAIPVGLLYNGVTVLMRKVPPADWVMKLLNDTSGARLFAAASIGLFQHASMLILIAPPVLEAMKTIMAGRSPGIKESFRDGYRRLGPLAAGVAIVYVVSGGLTLVLIGLPVAIFLAVRWQFFAQAVVLDGAGNGVAALRRSGAAVRGHWFAALALAIVLQAFGLLPGPIIGLLLLVFGKTSVQFSNALSSLLYAVTVPISLIGLTLAYERFLRENGRSPAPQRSGRHRFPPS